MSLLETSSWISECGNWQVVHFLFARSLPASNTPLLVHDSVVLVWLHIIRFSFS